MAISTYCRLDFLHPTKASSPISSKSPEVTCPQRRRSWKNQCLLGLTCAIIGLDICDYVTLSDPEWAFAVDMQSGLPNIKREATRWSDRRLCQPWRVNSLETIVPENLPRPSARRRWEATGFTEAAPPLKGVAKPGAGNCFTL